MGDFHDVSINLFSSLAGVGLGWLSKSAANRLRYRRARSFWRQFVGASVTVVIGQHVMDEWEPSGLLGVGDAFALSELQKHMERIGVRQPKIVYSQRVNDETRRQNMILIGGADCNQITQEVMTRLPGTLGWVDAPAHTYGIQDRLESRFYSPKPFKMGEGVDFGLLVRAPNPFNPDATVLVIAGSFGFGSWAGANLVRSPEFLRDPMVKSSIPFECLFKVDVAGSAPQAMKILSIRPLDMDQNAGRRPIAPV